nr:MAG TPA: hypothetical protein [Caudoviricetes sp.]
MTTVRILACFLCHSFHLFPWHFLKKYFFIFF